MFNWLLALGLANLLIGAEPQPGAESDSSGGISLRHNGAVVTKVERASFTLPSFPLLNPRRLDELSDKLEPAVLQPARNAAIGEDGRIVPEEAGTRLDRRQFEDRFQRYFYAGGPSSFEIPLKPIYAKVDSELLAQIREKPIGQYATYFNSRNKNRATNIALAAKSINNHVVFPGERFSFNETVGRRDQSKGYVRAPIIVRGELSEGIGGGICQVSSTLFNAADRAGLTILERYSHSRHVPYVLPGRDATVSWGGPDFAFSNPYGQPVLIRAFAGAGSLYVSIYSSEQLEHAPRHVPRMSHRIPEEIAAGKTE
ncbi:VanW family protein [Cohnella fermenti]|uniref:Peptidoglycan binding domain-containing protein n=1 Tax=Cohnella fermenti TaxID=2565925 RepID=A0A4V3WDY1_9BACL|nr:VanW family protein [Cohnella fermenti]THF74047.1 hypothetical protein E6C55_26515 [Cohnella fermenti]